MGDRKIGRSVVDRIDERVAFRFLNEVRLPDADSLVVSMDAIQAEAEALSRLGI